MKRRILFLIPNLAHGGAERVLVNLVNNLDRNKYDITVQTLFDVGVNKQYLKSDVRYIKGFKHYFRGNSQILKMFPPVALYRFFIRERYDILVSYLEGPTARIISGCPDANVKKICWIHIELNTPEMAAVGFTSIAEATACYNRFDKIVAVSKNVQDCLVSSLHIEQTVEVLYNTNETEKICELAQLEVIDSEFPYNQVGVPCVCSVAKLMKTKGYDRLIKVHRRLLDEGFPHHIFILGTGEEEGNLRRMISEAQVEDTFTLLGFKENPYQYMSKCDLYVCSSRREGFSTAVTEALVLGLPVVSTDCSGARELLGEKNEFGIVVSNDEDGIYMGMKQMLASAEVMEHYRIKADIRGKKFSCQETVTATENFFDALF